MVLFASSSCWDWFPCVRPQTADQLSLGGKGELDYFWHLARVRCLPVIGSRHHHHAFG